MLHLLYYLTKARTTHVFLLHNADLIRFCCDTKCFRASCPVFLFETFLSAFPELNDTEDTNTAVVLAELLSCS